MLFNRYVNIYAVSNLYILRLKCFGIYWDSLSMGKIISLCKQIQQWTELELHTKACYEVTYLSSLFSYREV